MSTVNEVKANLSKAREDLKALRVKLKEQAVFVKQLRSSLRMELSVARTARADARALKVQKRAEARAARIAKIEARLEALRLKQNAPKTLQRKNRKASPVKVVVSNGKKVA